MILRRIKAHVEKENWFAVGIDFFIVVIGVFIGLQVANWNDARRDIQRETQILHNIATDLRSDIADYSESIDANVTKIAAIKHILENANVSSGHMLTDDVEIDGMVFSDFYEQYLTSGSVNPEQWVESFRNKLWWHTVIVPNVAPSTTAFDSLVSTGDLSVIRNDELVGRLQRYRQLTTAIFKAQEVTFRPRRDNAIEIGLELGLSPFRTTDESMFLELVTNDPKLAATIQTQMGWAQGHLTMIAGAKNRAKLMLAQIENELGVETLEDEPPE